MSKQVEKNHYNFRKYANSERWFSYWEQLLLIIETNANSILEIGVGDGMVGSYIRNNLKDVTYTSLDFDESLCPDIVADVLDSKIEDGLYDVVCAFEVLEHLPIEKSILAFNEMCRMAKEFVIFSVPHWGRYFGIEFYLPFVKRVNFGIKLKSLIPPIHVFNGQHYWEVGKRGYSSAFIKKSFSNQDYVLINEFISYNNPYHHFYVYKRK